jgi:hypothetical protein
VVITQTGTPSVCLSSNVHSSEISGPTGSVTINVPLKVEDRGEDGPILASVSYGRGEPIRGRFFDRGKRPGSWLLFTIPRKFCPERGLLTLSASLDESVLWERTYRVIWSGRFPGLEPVP